VAGRTGVRLQSAQLPAADTLPEPTAVEVMFLYTPQTVIGEGNEESLRRRVLESVDEANFRLTNSLVNVRIQPVYIGRYDTFETGDMNRDAWRLANGADGMERVPRLRNDYKADLVCLITEWENQGIGGLAWDLTPPSGNPATGFTVIRRGAFGRGMLTLSHELGHLLGCAHDREHAGDVDSEFYRARKPYSFGHRFEVEGVTYVDVMSYPPGIIVPYFGNPRLALDGVPLGVSAGETRPSDGARTINETAPYVARYRTARSRIEFAEARVVTDRWQTNVVVGLRRTGDLESSTQVTVVFEANSSARAGEDYLRPASTLVRFETNQASAEITIPLSRTPVTPVSGSLPFQPEDSIHLSLSNVLGDHGIGLQRTCEVILLQPLVAASATYIEFPEGPLTVLESVGNVRVKVRFTGPMPQGDNPPAFIDCQTVGGTAVEGRDYTWESPVRHYLQEGAEWEIPIPILHRPEAGPDRTFHVVVGQRTNMVRILDEQRIGTFRGHPGLGLDADGPLSAEPLGDGRLLVWGSFSRLGGKDRTGVARLNPDGAVDDTFRPPEILLGHRRIPGLSADTEAVNANAVIATAVPRPDGRVLLAGGFSRVNGQPRSRLVQLLSDGRLDESFGRDLRFDGAVYAVALQPDGRVVVAGSFEHINGVRRPFIARLHPDGAVDESFQPNGGPTSDWTVLLFTLALQSDGKILMGGFFQRVDGKPMLNLARLNSDGTLDGDFKLKTGASGPVWRIRTQADGKIVVGGVFDTLGGRASKRLGRLNQDGTSDLTFRPPNPDADVTEIVCLPNGRLLVVGTFATVAYQSRRFLALLNADGTLVPDFDAGASTDRFLGASTVYSNGAAVQADGSLFLAGSFRRFNGLNTPHLVQLHLGPLAPSLTRARQQNGALTMTVHGLPGGVYAVESSGDLERWEPAGEVRLGLGVRESILSASSSAGSHFFRLRAPDLPVSGVTPHP
jgi:uncharacterized delta-60 repeat protein